MSKSSSKLAATKYIGSAIVRPSVSFTRPADTTAYASGDLVANDTVAGNVVPLVFTMIANPGQQVTGNTIKRARVRKTGTSVTNASFRLHLYSDIPVVTNGDNGAWVSTKAANWVADFDITVADVFSDGSAGAGVPKSGEGTEIQSNATTLYGLLEARGAYTPASAELFEILLETIQS